MSKVFQDWMQSKDEFVKVQVEQLANQLGLKCDFKGYYIEDNDYYLNTGAFPMFKTFKQYDEDTVSTKFMNHARYFFDLSTEKETYTATVHFYEADNKKLIKVCVCVCVFQVYSYLN